MLRFKFAAVILAICATCPAAEAQDSDKLTQKILDAFGSCLGNINSAPVKGGNMTEAELSGIGFPASNVDAARIDTSTGRLIQYRYRNGRGNFDACGVAFYGAPPRGIVDAASALIKKNAGYVEKSGNISGWKPQPDKAIFFGDPNAKADFHGATLLTREPSNDAPSFQADYHEMLLF